MMEFFVENTEVVYTYINRFAAIITIISTVAALIATAVRYSQKFKQKYKQRAESFWGSRRRPQIAHSFSHELLTLLPIALLLNLSLGPLVGPKGCDLRVMTASDASSKDELIDNFRKEFRSKKKECAVLIVGATSDSEQWTIAGYDDAKEFRTVDAPSHELVQELKKEPIDKSRVIKLATSSLDRTPPTKFYLDMIGTFLAALVLGPWWGALLGFFTNVLLAIQGPQYLPYVVVQVVGALYWGYGCRLGIVQKTLSNNGYGFHEFVISILILGGGGALIMSLLSAWVKDVVVGATAPSAFLSTLLVADSTFLNKIASEIASKVPTVIIGILLVRAMFPIFVRARVYEVTSSGWLPHVGFFVAFALLVYGLQESLGPTTKLSPIMSMGWILLFPILGVLHEVFFLKSAHIEHQDRMMMYNRLGEVAKDSDRAFDFTAVVTLMGFFLLAFVISALVEILEPIFVSSAMLFVLIFLIVAWTLEVSGRHNRLEQLMAAESSVSLGKREGQS